jgi:sugar phosphate isomerase/epimerase
MTMRIGGGIEKPYSNPEEWYKLVSELGYRAVLAPIDYRASREEKQAYLKCARDHDLIIGEVGAWVNAIATDENERKAAMTYIKNQLSLADELGANCCVNIAGSRGPLWDGFYKKTTQRIPMP